MSVTSLHSVSAWICVETIHKQNLEFVLADADYRRKQGRKYWFVYTTYSDSLYAMLQKEFETSETVSIDKIQEYGDIMFHLVADDMESLNKAIPRCEKVVQRWINKYNVEKMKAE